MLISHLDAFIPLDQALGVWVKLEPTSPEPPHKDPCPQVASEYFSGGSQAAWKALGGETLVKKNPLEMR